MSEIRTDTINNASGDNDSGIDLATNDVVKIKTADTTRLTVASDGTVQVNDVNLDLLDTDGDVTGRFRRSAGTNSVIIEADPANSASSSSIQFRTDASEAMRIHSGGAVTVGTTTASGLFHVKGSTSPLVDIHQESTTDITGIIMQHGRGLSGFTGTMVSFRRNDGTEVGSITLGASSTGFNTSSDHRLKENVTADWDATTRLKQLNPVRFNFIADADTTVDGFLAHEVQSVVPEAISGTHNEVEVWKDGEELPDGVSVGDNKLDEDGNTIPIMQGIDQSKLVPLLTGALKEAIEKIEALETRIEALENA